MQKVLKNYIPIDDTRLSDVTSIDLETILDNNYDQETVEARNSSISTEDSNIFPLTTANLIKWNDENPSSCGIIGIPADIPHDHEG